ncbi:hypothetical protein H5410_060036 [Solanum commersonii]|uniref:Uncharacterized protein n=1 Tax=Solanum commersonii TaxID=4109 RepID=A0A9J5W5B5_SOLCO|nr:hypothetical protein H5410_060036 [Solanum commersonii]
MELKFRHRDYKAEEQVHSLSRVAAETHPLSPQSPSSDQVQFVFLFLVYINRSNLLPTACI